MPHLTLEYSSNLASDDSIALLCRKLARSLDEQIEHGERVFPRGGIRVRAMSCPDYCIADGSIEIGRAHV
jgi:5-carboxymethyl-2-hydroxymuconate isomerase